MTADYQVSLSFQRGALLPKPAGRSRFMQHDGAAVTDEHAGAVAASKLHLQRVHSGSDAGKNEVVRARHLRALVDAKADRGGKGNGDAVQNGSKLQPRTGTCTCLRREADDDATWARATLDKI